MTDLRLYENHCHLIEVCKSWLRKHIRLGTKISVSRFDRKLILFNNELYTLEAIIFFEFLVSKSASKVMSNFRKKPYTCLAIFPV